jgi:hypothetical protein
LKSLNGQEVEYLLIGGYAVSYHGYPRSTADMDIWVATSERNAARIVATLVEFGFAGDNLSTRLFNQPDQITRLGNPPFRIEILTTISGVNFDDAYANRVVDEIDGIPVSIISYDDLKTNKRASGRLKDLADLDNLP